MCGNTAVSQPLDVIVAFIQECMKHNGDSICGSDCSTLTSGCEYYYRLYKYEQQHPQAVITTGIKSLLMSLVTTVLCCPEAAIRYVLLGDMSDIRKGCMRGASMDVQSN